MCAVRRQQIDSQARWLVLVDFDGTLTTRDADFQIADALLPRDRQGAYLPLAEAYDRLELSTSEYFQGYLRILDLPPEALAKQAERLQFRPGVDEIVETCLRCGFDLRIVSEGLDTYVLPALRGAGLGGIAVACNRLVVEGGAFRVLPAEGAERCERCLSCKGSYVRRAHGEGRRVAVIGDGTSDLCAARLADLVLARGVLRRHCEEEGIVNTPWDTLADVSAALRVLCTAPK